MFNSAQKDEKILHFCQHGIDIQRLCTMDIMKYGPTCVPPPLLTTKLLLAFSV